MTEEKGRSWPTIETVNQLREELHRDGFGAAFRRCVADELERIPEGLPIVPAAELAAAGRRTGMLYALAIEQGIDVEAEEAAAQHRMMQERSAELETVARDMAAKFRAKGKPELAEVAERIVGLSTALGAIEEGGADGQEQG